MKNFHKVSDQLYRSAQPSRKDFISLQGKIDTVINLRHFHSDRKLLKDLNLKYEHIVFATMWPEERDVKAFLKIIKKGGTCLVHCLHGSDRTGMMCALYRIEIQKWKVEEAIKEMMETKYGHHKFFVHLPSFIRRRYK